MLFGGSHSHTLTSLCYNSVGFNAENSQYDAVLHSFSTYSERYRWNIHDYDAIPGTCIADIRIHKKEEEYMWKNLVRNPQDDEPSMAETAEMMALMVAKSLNKSRRLPEGCIPLQFIGLHTVRDEALTGVEFTEQLLGLFDLTCCQFAIENPYQPALVRALNDDILELFSALQFMYYTICYTNTKMFKERIAKYMKRGYMFVGFKHGIDSDVRFENAELRHAGNASVVTSLFEPVQINSGATMDANRLQKSLKNQHSEVSAATEGLSEQTKVEANVTSHKQRQKIKDQDQIMLHDNIGSEYIEDNKANPSEAKSDGNSDSGSFTGQISMNENCFTEPTNSSANNNIALQKFGENQSKMKMFGSVETIVAGNNTQLCLHTPLLRNFDHSKRHGTSPILKDKDHHNDVGDGKRAVADDVAGD